MSTLLGKEDPIDFRSRLDSFRVDVHLSEDSVIDKNAINACYVVLNLLPRFLKCVRYEGPSNVLKLLQPSQIRKLNFGKDDWNASMTLVFGNKTFPDEKNPLYISSSGWSSYLSIKQPCSWSPLMTNSLGALYTGALAVGEVFKKLLPEINPDKISHIEYDLLTHGTAKQPVIEPKIPEIINLNNLAIVGCGAVGQALCLGLKLSARLTGQIILFDQDKLDQSNEQRYIIGVEEVRGTSKAQHMANFLQNSNPSLIALAVQSKFEDYVTVTYPNPLGEEVVVSVDNVWTRVNVQAALPKVVWNGWTDVASGSLRYGVSRHSLGNENECLSCSYYPDGTSPSELEMNSIMTGLPKDEIQQLLDNKAICTSQLIEKVSRNTGIPLQTLLPNINQPFHKLLHGDCGVFTQRIHGIGVTAPAPHQPMLAGILLASQLILSRLELPAETKLIESISDFDALKIPNSSCLFLSKKNPKCFCNDSVYKNAYKEKWNSNLSK